MANSSDSARIDGKGRVTIPKAIRERLGLEAGVEVTVEYDDSRVVLTPAVSRAAAIDRLEGCIDDTTRTAPPGDPEEYKSDWYEDLPTE
jgi:AbrB family looped-hinge helix DNA binding protein